MKTATQELIEKIKTIGNIRSLNTWLKKNEKRLIEQEFELLKDAAILAQKEYINAVRCYPPQFVVDRANKVVNKLVS